MHGGQGKGVSLEQAPLVQHSQECGQECPSSSHPKSWGPWRHPNKQGVLLLCPQLRGSMQPRVAHQEVRAGTLSHVDAQAIHQHKVILL